MQPLQLGDETVRFDRGDYVLDLRGQRAAVQLRPLPADHDNISFVVSVLNLDSQPINVDVSDIRIEGTKDQVHVLTRGDMTHKAEHRAGWAKFWTSMGGALVAAGQASQRDNYHVTTSTPWGQYSSTVSAPCWSCRAAAQETMAFTNARMSQIQNALDNTRSALGDQMLQITTLDPGDATRGRIFRSGFKHEAMTPIKLIVRIGSEDFAFAFRFAPDGTPAPEYRMVARMAEGPVSVTPAFRTSEVAPPAHPAPVLSQAVVRVPPTVRQPITRSLPSSPPSQMMIRSVADGASVANRGKWQHYFNALIETGVSKGQARQMADQEFGAIY